MIQPPSPEKRIERLEHAVSALATLLDMEYQPVVPGRSSEELIERILHPEHFVNSNKGDL